VFSTQGYSSARVPAIAREAGVSVGAFYRYFDDKRAVFIEVMQIFLSRQNLLQARFLGEWKERIRSGGSSGHDFIEAIMELSIPQYRHHVDLIDTYVAMSYEDAEIGAIRRAYDEADRRDWADFIAAVTTRDRIPSPIAAARLVDLAAEEVLRWAASRGGRAGTDVRSALCDMVERYLFSDEQ